MKLTVVIPNLNYGRYLTDCLNSLYAQSFQDFETILVDGGSTDCTFTVLRNFPKVKVLNDTPPQGPVKAVNKAISIMQGEYFSQLNADCILNPTIYEECIRVLESDRKLGMVYTSWQLIDDNGFFLGYAKQPSSFNRNLLLQGNYIDATSMVIRKSCFSQVGVFDERCPWSMDWIMAAKISSVYPVSFINKPLFRYRVHSGQITEEKSKREKAKAVKIIRSYYDWRVKFQSDVSGKIKSVGRFFLR